MSKRIYVEIKTQQRVLDAAKKRAVDEHLTKAELIGKALEIYLHTPIDKQSNQE